jgi:hypothetical protein
MDENHSTIKFYFEFNRALTLQQKETMKKYAEITKGTTTI